MRAPAEPARPGNFRAPTARMTGAARRNVKLATSSRSSPRLRPPTIHTPERLSPPGRAAIWSSPRRPLLVGQGGDAGGGVPGVGEIEGGPTTAFSVSGGLAAGNGVLVAKPSPHGRHRFFAALRLTALRR